MSSSEKKVNEKTYDISSIKHVTRKFLEVSRCSHAKQRQRNVQKKCAARAKFLFFGYYVTRDDSQQRFLAQHNVTTLLLYCFEWL